MKLISIGLTMLLVMFAATAQAADDTEALIALDKQWGEAAARGDTAGVGKLLTDKSVSISETGIRAKAAELAELKPEPAGTHYEPTDYKVTFLNPDTAIMTHSVKGTDAHYSLHVWTRTAGKWQVVATSTTPAQSKK